MLMHGDGVTLGERGSSIHGSLITHRLRLLAFKRLAAALAHHCPGRGDGHRFFHDLGLIAART
jgi:hypothetical protein